MKVLTTIDLLALPSLETPPAGHVGFGAKADGLYQKIGTVETKLSVEGHVHSAVTTAVAGFMSAADKVKLDGIATGANNYSHPTGAGYNHIPSGGAAGQFLKWSSSGVAVWAADNNTTYGVATTSANGLMSAADKVKLDGVATGANNYSLPTASATVLGGVKIGSNISISSGVISVAAPYTHPATHPATIITEDASHRFVTDTEKSTWNAKSNLALGTTSTTAYRGDLGAIAYNHSQSAHDYLPLAGGTLTGTATFNGDFRLNTPIQNYNPFTYSKLFDSIDTNLFAGKWNKIKVTANGVENTSYTQYLFDQSYEQYAYICGRDGDAPLVLNIDRKSVV